jgi:hypothetical protein
LAGSLKANQIIDAAERKPHMDQPWVDGWIAAQGDPLARPSLRRHTMSREHQVIVKRGQKYLTWNSVNRYIPNGEPPLWTPEPTKAAVFADEQSARAAIPEHFRDRCEIKPAEW